MIQQRHHSSGYRRLWPIVSVVLLLCSVLSVGNVCAADRERPFRIGVLTASWGPTPQTVGIRDGLVALGYRENEDFVIGIRFTQGDLSALPGAARELVQYEVDLILADTDDAAKAVQQATSQVPIVFAAVIDPVKLGLVESFARPGGNITGVSDLGVDLHPKRLELLRAMIPSLHRVLLPYDATSTLAAAEVKSARQAAQRLGIELIELGVRSQAEAQKALAEISKGDVDGILAPRCCSMNIPGYVLEATARQKIPAIFDSAFWPERHALVSYGPDYYASGKQAVRLVDKIMKGAKPAELPVEQPTKFYLTLNLKAAKALGITFPPSILLRADRIIE